MATLDLPILVPGIRLDREDPEEEARALRRAKEPWLAGFILFGGEAEQVRRLTERLRAEAGRPIFIASDMERGAGQQVQGLTHLPDAGLIGLAGTPLEAYAIGALTASEARSVGIDVVFAPVVDVRSELDNPILGNRAFGFEPGRVGALAAATAAGIRAGGALPVAKHFPGHGATREDSHDAVPRVEVAAHVLRERDLEPFHHVLWWSACPAIMTAHVAYPALDPSGCIATFSKPIVDIARSLTHPDAPGLLVFTDALLMAGALGDGGEAQAARRALEAGCDVLLYPEYPEQVAADLLGHAAGLEAQAERAAAEVGRFLALRDAVAARTDEQAPRIENPAERVVDRAVRMATEGRLTCSPDALVVIDDDDIALRGQVLAERAAREGVPCEIVRVPKGERPALAPVPEGVPGVTGRTIVVMASVRAWKGASRASEACRTLVSETLERVLADGGLPTVLWCTPRPEDWRHLHLPGTGPHLEHALADALFPDAEGLLRSFGVGDQT